MPVSKRLFFFFFFFGLAASSPFFLPAELFYTTFLLSSHIFTLSLVKMVILGEHYPTERGRPLLESQTQNVSIYNQQSQLPFFLSRRLGKYQWVFTGKYCYTSIINTSKCCYTRIINTSKYCWVNVSVMKNWPYTIQ